VKISQRRNKRLLAILAFELVVLVAVGVFLGQATKPAASGTANLSVYGYVRNMSGTPLEGASVSVTVVETPRTLATTTDATGFYIVEFDLADWDVGDHIEVVATYDALQQMNTTIASDLTVEQVDINYTYEIPEFGGVGGSLVAIIAVAGVAGLFILKRPR